VRTQRDETAAPNPGASTSSLSASFLLLYQDPVQVAAVEQTTCIAYGTSRAVPMVFKRQCVLLPIATGSASYASTPGCIHALYACTLWYVKTRLYGAEQYLVSCHVVQVINFLSVATHTAGRGASLEVTRRDYVGVSPAVRFVTTRPPPTFGITAPRHMLVPLHANYLNTATCTPRAIPASIEASPGRECVRTHYLNTVASKVPILHTTTGSSAPRRTLPERTVKYNLVVYIRTFEAPVRQAPGCVRGRFVVARKSTLARSCVAPNDSLQPAWLTAYWSGSRRCRQTVLSCRPATTAR